MDMVTLVLTTIAISSSGTLSPGPLTVATLAIGSKCGWRGGWCVALGHTIFELPYILMLYLFISSIRDLLEGIVGDVVAVMGAGTIAFFAIVLLKDSLKKLKGVEHYTSTTDSDTNGGWARFSKNPVMVGIVFTGLNIWFLLWWLSIGFGLLTYVSDVGLSAIGVMYLSHVWIDFAWLISVAEAGRRGARLIGARGYNLFMVFLGLLLLFFGLNVALKRFTSISLLP